ARRLLTDAGINATSVLTDGGRPTTLKERYLGRAQQRHPQQMMRVDYERRDAIAEQMERGILASLHGRIADFNVVLISDYDKGVCKRTLLAELIGDSQRGGVRVIADPMRGGDYRKYRGCSVVTPNRLEAGLATGLTIRTNEEARQAAARLRDALGLEA